MRPLTDAEAERLRYLDGTNPARQRPVIVALLLSGAWASEIASLTAASFDSATARLTLPGVGDRHGRTLTVQPGAARIVTARIGWLQTQTNTAEPRLTANTGTVGQRRTRAYMVARTAIVRGGLVNDPTVTPASLTLWAGRHVFETTNHIEAAAKLIGLSSLDAAAVAIAWDWRETG